MPPKVAEAHLEARRQQVLDAAFTCFARQGFHQTTMQDICREAGLSAGAVYRYFPSKEEIIEASCQECQQYYMSMIEAATQRGDRPVGLLDELVGTTFAYLDQPEAHVWLRFNVQLWSEALRSPEIKESLRRTGIDPWKEALTQFIAKAQGLDEVSPALDPEAVARVLLSMWQGLILQKALDPAVDVTPYVEAVKAMYGGSFLQEVATER